METTQTRQVPINHTNPPFVTILQAARCHQYAKNSLIFLPLLVGHHFVHPHLVIKTILAFFSFSFLASTVYLLNDIIDRNVDKKHPVKKYRPIASGLLSIPAAISLAVVFSLMAISLTSFLPSYFKLTLLAYFLITLGYSFIFKRIVLVDVLVLSGLYSLRIFAGMTLVPHGYSDWLILLSLFFFTSLAFIKRYIELEKYPTSPQGRGYKSHQTLIVSVFGISSGYISSLVFALYVSSNSAFHLYHHTKLLYFVCPILLYWISYIWLAATEGKVHDDPVVFALKDKATYLTLLTILIISLMATL